MATRAFRFSNRTQAGQYLATKLVHYRNRDDTVVLALPRGGVPVAFEVALALRVPLDVFVVRKLGTPGHEELAMGAIASGGVRVLNNDVIRPFNIGQADIEAAVTRETQELQRRERAYRGGRPPLSLHARTVILIDDGLATGSTMRAAVAALQHHLPARIVVAVPVAAPDVYAEIHTLVDEMVCLLTPDPLWAVGHWYADFTQVSDEEVCLLLEQSALRQTAVQKPTPQTSPPPLSSPVH